MAMAETTAMAETGGAPGADPPPDGHTPTSGQTEIPRDVRPHPGTATWLRRLWTRLCAMARTARRTAATVRAPLVDGTPYSHAGALAIAACDGLIRTVAPDAGGEALAWVLLVATCGESDPPALRRQIVDALASRSLSGPLDVQFVALPWLPSVAPPAGKDSVVGQASRPDLQMVARLATAAEAWAAGDAGAADGAVPRGGLW